MADSETFEADALVPQLPVIQEESQLGSDTEENDGQIRSLSELRRYRGRARSSYTKYITHLADKLRRNPPLDRNELLHARQKLVRLFDEIETRHLLVIEACSTREELDRRTTAAMPVDGQSVRSVRSSRSSSSRRSSRSTEARLQEKELHIKETELKVKQAQEEARIRLEEEDRIRRLDEEKRREQLKVDAERTQRQLKDELERFSIKLEK